MKKKIWFGRERMLNWKKLECEETSEAQFRRDGKCDCCFPTKLGDVFRMDYLRFLKAFTYTSLLDRPMTNFFQFPSSICSRLISSSPLIFHIWLRNWQKREKSFSYLNWSLRKVFLSTFFLFVFLSDPMLYGQGFSAIVSLKRKQTLNSRHISRQI